MARFINPLLKHASISSYARVEMDPEATNDGFSNESLLGDGYLPDGAEPKPNHFPTRDDFIKRVAATLWTLITIVVFLSGLYLHLHTKPEYKQIDSFWTPIWNEVDPAYHLVRFNGTLDAESDFRGPPSSAVDVAWSLLDDFGSVALNEDEFIRAGGSVENSKMPDDLGGGYMADIEILHQMHCLNFVRMAAYSDHYSHIAPEWKDSKHTFSLHLDHCIEMLRINLLCRTDAGIIPFRWVEDYQRPLPDFSTMHKCRNWEGVFEWARKREVVVPKGYEWKSQPGEKRFPRPKWMLPPDQH